MVYLTILYLQYNQSLYFYFWLLWLSRLFDCSWGLKKLEVKDCKIGDIVLTFSGSVFEISEISRNKKRENDLTIAVGVGEN
jgi:hypothetical protein